MTIIDNCNYHYRWVAVPYSSLAHGGRGQTKNTSYENQHSQRGYPGDHRHIRNPAFFPFPERECPVRSLLLRTGSRRHPGARVPRELRTVVRPKSGRANPEFKGPEKSGPFFF